MGRSIPAGLGGSSQREAGSPDFLERTPGFRGQVFFRAGLLPKDDSRAVVHGGGREPRIPGSGRGRGHRGSPVEPPGSGRVIAAVRLNRRDLGVFWKPPFRVEITGIARPGDNLLEVDVTNLWPNRLIGDAQLPDDCQWEKDTLYGRRLARWPAWLLEDKPSPVGRFTFATWNVWPKEAPLIKSGLLGPVSLLATARVRMPVR